MRSASVVLVTLCFAIFLGSKSSAEISQSIDAAGIQLAAQRISSGTKENAIDSPSKVVVVYFTPQGRLPAKGHLPRIRRIVQTTADFYHDELSRHGFADRKMKFHREDGKIAVIDVVGAEQDYDKPDGNKIRQEIVPVLLARKIDPRKSVLLIFCNLMDYDAQRSRISYHSPYYGGGSYLSGSAWQCDSEILDPLRFTERTPIRDGEYGKITIGRHNSIFIGGVIHELGHALSLPHCMQRSDQAVRGTALMGSGNRTFREELRGEGRGTFLTQAHALRLAAHPVFLGKVTSQLRDRPQVSWDDLQISVAQDNTISVRAQITTKVPTHGVVAYFDPAGRGDYDSTTSTAIPDDNGTFELRSGSLKANRAGQLRLVTCHINGSTSERVFDYRINESGRPDLSSIQLQLKLSSMIDAIRAGDLELAAARLDRIAGADDELKKIGERVIERFRERTKQPAASMDPAMVPLSTRSIDLSVLKPSSAKVGWLRPTFDQVPEKETLLSIGGDYFARGIYAHAPARHIYQLDRNWKQLDGLCGLQAGHRGKVDFEILGDGKLLWNQRSAGAGQSYSYKIDVSQVKKLTLVVTEGGNGAGADWGVWVQPTLTR